MKKLNSTILDQYQILFGFRLKPPYDSLYINTMTTIYLKSKLYGIIK